jgi:membrane peptidoglycan carboxypeptidase
VDDSAPSSPDLLRSVGGDPKGPFMAEVPYRLALTAHLVPAAMRIAAKLSPESAASMYRKVGLTVSNDPTLREVLGDLNESFLDIVNAYAIISQKGIFAKSTALLGLTDDGKAIAIAPNATQVVTEPPTAFVLATMLRDELERPPYNTDDERFYRNFYGKAGAALDGTNAYFVGFNGRYLIAVHVKPVLKEGAPVAAITGNAHALPIWAEFVRALPAEQLHIELDRAFGTYCVGIDPVSGLRTEEDRPRYFSCFRTDMRAPEFTESKKPTQLPSLPLD